MTTEKKAPAKKQGMFIKNIMAGVGGFVPVGLAVWLAWALIMKVDHAVIGQLMTDGSIMGGLPDAINPGTYAPVLYMFPGIGIIFVTAGLFFGGVLIRTWIGNKIKTLIHYLMEQVPFVGAAFKMIKKVIDQVTAADQDAPEKKAVMVEHLRDDAFAPAFSLGVSTMFKHPRTGERLEVIYFPSAPNPTSGWIILMPASLVHDCEYGSDTQMEFVLSCGFSQEQVDSVVNGAIKADILPTGDIVTTQGVVEVSPHDSEQEELDAQPTLAKQAEVSETFDEPKPVGSFVQELPTTMDTVEVTVEDK